MRNLWSRIIPLAGRLFVNVIVTRGQCQNQLSSFSRVSASGQPWISSRQKSGIATEEPVLMAYSEYWDANSKGPGGHPVLMTHGLLGSRQNWNSIAKSVAKMTGRKVITFDARNHGDSPHVSRLTYDLMCDDILHFADTLGIQKFSLLGHSMGGRTVMAFGLMHPKRIEKLVVVDMSPLTMSRAFGVMRSYLEALMSIKLDSSLSLSEGRKIADEKLTAVTDEPGLRAFLLTNLARTDDKGFYWKPNLQSLLDNLEELQDFPSRLLERQLLLPSLFIAGGESHYVPVSDYDGIKEIFPQAEFFSIAGSGHWPQADNPSQFIPVLVNFLTDG